MASGVSNSNSMKKDAEGVAEELHALSDGKIKTGVYHADRHDREKDGLHVAWRKGTIKVVCATIGKESCFGQNMTSFTPI